MHMIYTEILAEVNKSEYVGTCIGDDLRNPSWIPMKELIIVIGKYVNLDWIW